MEINKPDLARCNKLLDDGFSLITVNENKIPNIRWKEYQTSAMKKDTFENFYQLPTSKGVGIVCGYSDLEVLDIDLKVYSTIQERNDFWSELLSLFKDNFPDFENKIEKFFNGDIELYEVSAYEIMTQVGSIDNVTFIRLL